MGETAKTISTLFPQRLQVCALFFVPALAETSVFDLTLSAIWVPPFSFSALYVKLLRSPLYVYQTRRYPVHILSGMGTSDVGLTYIRKFKTLYYNQIKI